MSFEVAIKVDVDTFVGTRDGAPRLLRLFHELQVPASFFVTMGPDNSGKAIRRVFTRKGFLRKMLRTRATGIYGWRTVLSGTLLPAPMAGSRFPALLRGLAKDGHDVGPHGWDHVDWHDRLRRMDLAETRRQFERGFAACAEILGRPPEGSAAPGWQCTAESLAVQDDLGIIWHSDVRGTHPFIPAAGGREFRGLEIPSTLPTLDEVLGSDAASRQGLAPYFQQLARRDQLNVLTVHAELEGGASLGFLRELIGRWRSEGATFVRLSDVARRRLVDSATLPRHEVIWGQLPGRAGEVACQGRAVFSGDSGDRNR